MLSLALATILVAAPADDTRAAVTALADALATKDPAKASAVFAADAAITFVVDSVAPAKRIPDESYVGADPVWDFLDAYARGWSAEMKDLAVDGDRATWTWSIASERFRKLGIERVDARAEAGFRDGKVRMLTLAASPESSARLVAEIPAANKARIRAYIDEVNRRDYAWLDVMVAKSFENHSFMPMGPGAQGLKDFYKEFSRAFPDFKFTIEDIIAEGDTVAARITARYTHKGEFLGVAPTNKAVTVMKFDFFKMAGGKCIAHWDVADRMGLLQQLGVLPQVPRWSATPGYEGFR